MQTISLKSHVGADGVLTLNVPLNVCETDLEVLVVVQPLAKNGSNPQPGWPPGFFEETAGAWQGEPLERPDQGEFEVREELV